MNERVGRKTLAKEWAERVGRKGVERLLSEWGSRGPICLPVAIYTRERGNTKRRLTLSQDLQQSCPAKEWGAIDVGQLVDH